MKASANKKKTENIFLRMHPLQRIFLSLVITGIGFVFLSRTEINWKIQAVCLWDVFAITYVITSWIVFFTRPMQDIARQANTEDGSRGFVLISVLVSSFAGMFAVLLLMISDDDTAVHEAARVLISVLGMLASWTLLHSIFTFHYAHLYYFRDEDKSPEGFALDFPNEEKPDYLDFAYFAFVIGMTFQVSDVQVNSKVTRRTVLAHGLLSFALNTFVVALTINLIAGLKK
jgi:uncharacterized membrane protein